MQSLAKSIEELDEKVPTMMNILFQELSAKIDGDAVTVGLLGSPRSHMVATPIAEKKDMFGDVLRRQTSNNESTAFRLASMMVDHEIKTPISPM